MKISLNWLREYVSFDESPARLAEVLTTAGVEVENIEVRGVNLENVVVAQIVASEPHPNADRLSVCRVDDGSGQPPRQIVCGAKNFKVGDKVPLALPGAVLPGDVRIKVGKLRGVESEGMLCSAKELRLSEESEGLLILANDTPVGLPIGEHFPSDTIFEVEVTPNRSDLLSHFGLAREVAALTGATLRDPLAAMEDLGANTPVAHLPIVIAANAREACPFYTARVIDDVQVAPSPDWLRARLETVGVRSINNVVDVTNFVMLELGQPLHAFDAAKVGAGGIGARLAGEGETLKALDGKTYKLSPHHLVIARVDAEKAADPAAAEGLAGIMGGEESKVTVATRTIILESAYFAPAGIRQTSRELGLTSDAAYRFERGVDPEGVVAASRRAEDLLGQICGGQSRGLAQSHPLHGHDGRDGERSEAVTLRLSRCQAMIDQDLTQERVEEILTGFGLRIIASKPKTAGALENDESSWRIPSYRLDLRREIDLIEEVARVHGLDRITGRAAAWFAPSSKVDAAYDFQMKVRRTLAGLGFHETRGVSLVRADPAAAGVALRNPLGEENAVLRGTLLPGLLATAGRNARQGAADLRLFEIGRIFSPDIAPGESEPTMVALLMTGARELPGWRHGADARALDLYDLRAVLEQLFGGASLELRPMDPPAGSKLAATMRIFVQNQPAGGLGLLTPAHAKELELRGSVVIAEVPLALLMSVTKPATFAPLARFPGMTRDLGVVVARTLPHGNLESVLRNAREPLLESIALFDVFTDDRGEKVAADKKSLAYSLTYRADNRTLVAEEVNAAHARLKGALQAGFDGLQFRE